MFESALPKSLWSIRDRIIDKVHSNEPIPNDVTEVTDWLECDGYDLLNSCWNGERLVNLDEIWLDDEQVREEYEFDYLHILSDQLRAQLIRQAINNTLSLEADLPGIDGVVNPSMIAFPLIDSKGRSAILGCLIEIHGQGGPVCLWQGAFGTSGEFMRSLKGINVWPLEEIMKASDSALVSNWRYVLGNASHEKLRAAPLEERLRLVCKDLDRASRTGRSQYRSMDEVLLAELLGVENFEDSPSDWERFDAFPRRNLDQIFYEQGLDGEELSWFIDSAENQSSEYEYLPQPSAELLKKSSLIKRIDSSHEARECLGERLTLKLEEIVNMYQLRDEASNGIYGHAIWTYKCPEGRRVRFQIDIGDTGEVENILGPYDDLKGRFSDGPDYVVEYG